MNYARDRRRIDAMRIGDVVQRRQYFRLSFIGTLAPDFSVLPIVQFLPLPDVEAALTSNACKGTAS